MMKAAVVLLLLLSSCSLRTAKPASSIIENTPKYAIIQINETRFSVIADSATRARQIIDEHLCYSRPCSITPVGVIYNVERLNEKPK